MEEKDQPSRRNCLGKEDRDGNVHVSGRNSEPSTAQRTGTGGKWRLQWKAVAKLKDLQGTDTRAEIFYSVDNREP